MTATSETETDTTTNGELPKAFLNRSDLLSLADTAYDEFQVPAWNGAWVRIRSLTSAERDRYEAGINTQKNGKPVTNLEQARAKLCVLTLVDAAGNQLFNQRDVAAFGGKNSDAVNYVFRRSCKLSGILQTEDDMEEVVGNSETTPDSDS